MKLKAQTMPPPKNFADPQNEALLAYWRFKEDTKEFDCSESFKITQPLPFIDMNYHSGKRNQKIFLYRSQSNEIFWFSREKDSIYLNIIEKNQRLPRWPPY